MADWITDVAPYAWLLGGEYPNNHLRAHTYGVATALNFLGNWLGVFTAPYFINPASLGWSAKYGYVNYAESTHHPSVTSDNASS